MITFSANKKLACLKWVLVLTATLLHAMPATANNSVAASADFCKLGSLFCEFNKVDKRDLFAAAELPLGVNDSQTVLNLFSDSKASCNKFTEVKAADLDWKLGQNNQSEVVSLVGVKAIRANNYTASTRSEESCRAGEMPLPATTWLLASALIGFVGLSNKRRV